MESEVDGAGRVDLDGGKRVAEGSEVLRENSHAVRLVLNDPFVLGKAEYHHVRVAHPTLYRPRQACICIVPGVSSVGAVESQEEVGAGG